MDKPVQIEDMSSLKENFIRNSCGIVEDGGLVYFHGGMYWADNMQLGDDIWRLFDHTGNLVEKFGKTPEVSLSQLADAAARHYARKPESATLTL